MKKPTFYEQLGIVIPGSVFLFGLMFFFRSLRQLLAKDGVSVGELGIFALHRRGPAHLARGRHPLRSDARLRLPGVPLRHSLRARDVHAVHGDQGSAREAGRKEASRAEGMSKTKLRDA